MRVISSASRTDPLIAYRPGLDGLRALAVAAVILYHADVSWARAGFLGVDVFFVSSGYLITSLLLTEHRARGRIDLMAFWSRRARRLLPALFLLLGAVAVYAVVGARADELGRIRGDGFASLLYASNWKFVLDGTSYFQAFRTPSPLAHTWSLAIEEQWYLLWPPALLLMLRVVRSRARLLAGVIGVLAVGSAALMAALYHAGADPSRVYFGTDTRGQALLIGAVLAALTSGPEPAIRLDHVRRAWLVQVLGLAGAAALTVTIARADPTGPFLYRGGFFLVAIASVLLIAGAVATGPISRVLSVAPLRSIGAVSYGLYLWHWPVDVMLDEVRTGRSGLALFAVRISVTAALATVSYHVVERPIRRDGLAALRIPKLARTRVAILPATAAIVAMLLAACTLGAVPEPNLTAFARAQRIATSAPDPRKTRVLMLGDSQMLTLLFYGSTAFTSSGPQYDSAAILGCGVLGPGMQSGGSCDDREATWNARIQTFDPDLSVLLVGAWESLDFTAAGHRYVHATDGHERELVDLAGTAIHTLTSRGGRVALLEVPCFGNPNRDDADGLQRSSPASVAGVNQALRTVAERDPAHVTFVPWASAICPNGAFAPTVDGVDVRPDGIHFGSTTATNLVTDRLAPTLRDLAITAHTARSDPPAAR